MDWAQILVIILASLFAIFMLFAIVLAVLIMKVTRQIKAATSNAERTIAAVELAASAFGRTSVPLTIGRLILSKIMKSYFNKQSAQTGSKRKGGENE